MCSSIEAKRRPNCSLATVRVVVVSVLSVGFRVILCIQDEGTRIAACIFNINCLTASLIPAHTITHSIIHPQPTYIYICGCLAYLERPPIFHPTRKSPSLGPFSLRKTNKHNQHTSIKKPNNTKRMNSPASLRHMLNLKFNFIARLYLNYCAVIFYCTFQSFVMVAATPASTSLERRTGICASCHRSRLCIPIQRPQKKSCLKSPQHIYCF